MKRKKRKPGPGTIVPGSPRKMSEMVWEFAGEFIRSGGTLEEKQNRINPACSAWNMACSPPEVRSISLDQYIESYRSYNPEADDDDVSNIRVGMEELMRNKLSLFPAVNNQIVGGAITRREGKDHIEISSARIE